MYYAQLSAVGWQVYTMVEANIQATPGVAIREFPLATGYGFADYLLYGNAKAATARHRPQTSSVCPAAPPCKPR